MRTSGMIRGASVRLALIAAAMLMGFGVQHYVWTTADADLWPHAQRLTADRSADDDWLGFSVALDGEMALVGSPFADTSGDNSGTAYLFRCDPQASQQTAMFGGEDTAARGDFGYSVALDGNRALVGKPGDPSAGESTGAAYLYQIDDQGNWSRAARLAANDPTSQAWFGVSVSLHHDIAMVGTRGDAGFGAAYVFQKDHENQTQWREVARLSSGEEMDHFGLNVAIRDDLAVVGANGAAHNAGAAYVYERDSSGVWNQRTKLNPPDDTSNKFFGKAVAISGRNIVVGAPGNLTQCGAVHVFHQDDTGRWRPVAKITARNESAGAQFGREVAICDRWMAVGAPWEDSAAGAVYLFAQEDSRTWRQLSRITLPDRHADDWFGNALAISRDALLVGAHYGQGNTPNSGAAYRFRLPTEGESHSTTTNVIAN